MTHLPRLSLLLGFSVSSLLLAAQAAGGDYPVSFDPAQSQNHASRHLDGVSLTSPSYGRQTVTLTDYSKSFYQPEMDRTLLLKAGETVQVSFHYTGTWMSGYVYLDRGNDGQFSAALDEDLSISEGSDIMAFSYYQGRNSAGASVPNGDVLNPPAFVVPADLEPGFYRMRFKVDWDCIDPAGNASENNSLTGNGGGIIDVRVGIVDDEARLQATATHGRVTAADGSPLASAAVPAGRPFDLLLTPETGYVASSVKVRSGYRLDGEQMIHGNRQYDDIVLPAYLARDGRLTLPGTAVAGDVRIEADFRENRYAADAGTDYALRVDTGTARADVGRSLSRIVFNATRGGRTSLTVGGNPGTVYRPMLDRSVSVVPGDEITATLTYSGTPLGAYLYIDLNQDGQLLPDTDDEGRPTAGSELVSFSRHNGFDSLGEPDAGDSRLGALPAFRLPEQLPTGVYRARLKLDTDDLDPAGRYAEGGSLNIDAEGGYIIDFLINVHNPKHPLRVHSPGGYVSGANHGGLPAEVTPYTQLTVMPQPCRPGYKAERITIRHGHNLDGPQYIHGNRQWGVYERNVTSSLILQRDSIDGDVELSLEYRPTASATESLVFSDEFDSRERTDYNRDVWAVPARQGAAWNRFISASPDVAYLENGELVTRCFANPDKTADSAAMLSGAVQSSKSFNFKYGYVEARIKTNPHSGNFPAFWLMPQDQSAGWPSCGEIDIWEQINTEERAYQTVHSHWTYDLGQTGNPRSSYFAAAQVDGYYNVYGLEWDEDQLNWYVNGKKVASYARSTDANALAQGQWPFDKAFYIILNQSVGTGSWAAAPDMSHTYQTVFDWVRVYQYDENAGIRGTAATDSSAPDVYPGEGCLHYVSARPSRIDVYDLRGRHVHSATVEGNGSVSLPRGIYVAAGKKLLVR